MYRWFLILVLLNFADSAEKLSRELCRTKKLKYCRPSKARHYGHPHNYYHGDNQTETVTSGPTTVQPLPPANTFEDLAQNLAAAESAVKKYCRDNSNGDVQELFLNTYVLKYRIGDFKKNNINVKIKHRVIYVTAKQEGLKPFNDLRILPSIVNTRLASWVLEKNNLLIVIPFNVAFKKEVLSECGDVNDAIIEVPPKRKTNKSFQYRMNEEMTEVPQTTTTAQPETPEKKDTDALNIDDALAIVFPDTVV